MTALLAAVGVAHTEAAMVQYTVDPAQSSLSISGASVDVPLLGSSSLIQQDVGSLTTSYSGTIDADLTASTLQLLSTTNLIAGNSGPWYPDFTPANYGLTGTVLVTVYGATRGLELQLSDAAAKPLTAGSFDEAGTTAAFTAGTTTYDTVFVATNMATISPVLTQNATGTGTLSTAGGIETLTIPVSFTATFTESSVGAQFTVPFIGTIIATRTVPEPASAGLLAIGAVFVAAIACSRKNRTAGGQIVR